ncbi:hypothetical protein BH23PLA1_BH23PLA1_30090 [soil metagenome]
MIDDLLSECGGWCEAARRLLDRNRDSIVQPLAMIRAIHKGISLRRRIDETEVLAESDSTAIDRQRSEVVPLLDQLQAAASEGLADLEPFTARHQEIAGLVEQTLQAEEAYLTRLLTRPDLDPLRRASLLDDFRDDLMWLGALVARIEGHSPSHPALAARLEADRLGDLLGHPAPPSLEPDRSELSSECRRIQLQLLGRHLEQEIDQSIEPEQEPEELWSRRFALTRLQAEVETLEPVEAEPDRSDLNFGEPARWVDRLAQKREELAEAAANRLANRPAEDRVELWREIVGAARIESNEVLSALEELAPEHAAKLLELSRDDMARLAEDGRAGARECTKAGDQAHSRPLARAAVRLDRLRRSARNELQEKQLTIRLQQLFGPRFPGRLDNLVLVLILVLTGLIAAESIIEHRTGELPIRIFRWFAWADLAICSVFLAEFALKISLAQGKWLYFRRHWLIDLLPSIPYGFLTYQLMMFRDLERIQLLRTLRLPRLVRYLKLARPLIRFVRLFLFVFRFSDRLVRRYATLFNRNILLFEPRRDRDTESRSHHLLASLRQHYEKRSTEWYSQLDEAQRLELTRRSLADLRRRLEHLPDARAGSGAEPIEDRDIPVEALVERLIEMTPEELFFRTGQPFVEMVDRYIRLFDVPILRRLPIIRQLVAHRDQGPAESAALAANYLGHLIQRFLDIIYYFADLQATVSAPLFLERLGVTIVQATRRPAQRLLTFGTAFLILYLAVEGVGGVIGGRRASEDRLTRQLGGLHPRTVEALVREGFQATEGRPFVIEEAKRLRPEQLVALIPAGRDALCAQADTDEALSNLDQESATALVREGLEHREGHSPTESELEAVSPAAVVTLIPEGYKALCERPITAEVLAAIEPQTVRSLFTDRSIIRPFVRRLQALLGWPVIILGLICWAFLLLGGWLRKIANQAADFSQRIVEAQFAAQTKELKVRRREHDMRFLAERVLRPELELRLVDDQPDPGEKGEQVDLDGRLQGLSLDVRIQADEAGFLRPFELLYNDYLDGSPFHRNDTKTATQLLGNLALRNLTRSHLSYWLREGRRLERLDLNRAAASLLGGPHLWFDYITRMIVQETAKLLLDYNRNAIPQDRLACSPQRLRKRYQTWLSRRLEIEPEAVNLPDPVGRFGDAETPTPARRREEADDFFETVEFTAIDFLVSNPQCDEAIGQRYGQQVLELLRRDRRQNLRRAFRSFPLHQAPQAWRTINPFALYEAYLSRGRLLILPFRFLSWIIKGLVFLISRVVRVVREILNPRFIDRPEEPSDTFASAIRKIHRMRKPAFIESLWLRARFDVEYLGLPLPWVPISVGTDTLIERDLDFIGATRHERIMAERMHEDQRQRLLRIGRWLGSFGWDFHSLPAMLDRDFPHLANRTAEVIRALVTAAIVDHDDIYTLCASIDALRLLMAHGADPKADPHLLPTGLPEPMIVRQPLWYSSKEPRRPVPDLLNRPCFPNNDEVQHRQILRYLRRHRKYVRGWLVVLQTQGGPDPVETLRSRFQAVLLRSDLWSDQILVLRTIQTLTMLDVHHYGELVWKLGGYDQLEPAVEATGLPFTLPDFEEPALA